jgi:epoxyqueuosine reductase QueG
MNCLPKNYSFGNRQRRLTPQKDLCSFPNAQDFSFSDWKDRHASRSPTTVSTSKRSALKLFSNPDQKSISKLFRSYDDRKTPYIDQVKQMNSYIKRLINDSSYLQKKISHSDLSSHPPKPSDIDNMYLTPYFTNLRPKSRFPREVFTSFRSKSRF